MRYNIEKEVYSIDIPYRFTKAGALLVVDKSLKPKKLFNSYCKCS